MVEPPNTDDKSGRLQRVLAWAERIGQTGSWEYVPSEREELWSDNLYRIFGLEPGAIEPSGDYVIARMHRADRARFERAVATFLEHGETTRVEYRFAGPNGDRRHLRATLVVADRRDGRVYRMVGLTEDLTERRRAEREIAAHVAVEEALGDWQDLESGALGLLSKLAGALDCVIGVFWVPSGDVLVPRVRWYEREGELDVPEVKATKLQRQASGLAARAWAARKPLSWTLGGLAQPADPRASGPRDQELSGAIALPALSGDDVLAIIELRAHQEIQVGERLLRSLYGISHELGHFFARRGGELNEPPPLLTAREVEMLQLAAHGLSVKETGERLHVSPATVKTHLENIYRKLDVSDKPSAVATALRLGVID